MRTCDAQRVRSIRVVVAKCPVAPHVWRYRGPVGWPDAGGGGSVSRSGVGDRAEEASLADAGAPVHDGHEPRFTFGVSERDFNVAEWRDPTEIGLNEVQGAPLRIGCLVPWLEV